MVISEETYKKKEESQQIPLKEETNVTKRSCYIPRSLTKTKFTPVVWEKKKIIWYKKPKQKIP